MRITLQEQYNHFIQGEINRCRFYFDELHLAYSKKNQLFKLIVKHKDYLTFLGVNYKSIEDIQYDKGRKKINVSNLDFDNTPTYIALAANIKVYLYITLEKIPRLKDRIKFHSYLSNIPLSDFRDIYSSINNEISNILIKGGQYSFSKGVGKIRINRFKRNPNVKVVDRGETNKLKKLRKDNYIVFRTDDYFNAVFYNKKNAVCKNNSFYKFKLTSFINTVSRNKQEFYESVKKEEDIINEAKIGNLEKMLAMTKLHGINYYERHGV